MKKFFVLTAIAAATLALGSQIFTSKAFAQEDSVYFRTVFVATDALGSTDTVVFVVKEGATHGIDTNLGEVNLYGVPPQKELDMRIIQRTTESICSIDDLKFWLCRAHSGSSFEFSSEENIDLKVDYRYTHNGNFSMMPYSPVIKLYAQHYPVSIHIVQELYPNARYFMLWQYNEETGMSIAKINEGGVVPSISPSLRLLCTLNDASENNLLWVGLDPPHISIADTTVYKQPLYPKPSNDFVMIEGLETQELHLFDMTGSFIISFFLSENPYRLDISNLPVGTYFLKNKNNYSIYKFIKGGK